jgi:2-iminobutanoate/2-iminopropanoate deaminase
MDIRFMTIPDAPPPPPTAAYSHAVRAGDFLYVTGQLGVDPATNTLAPGGAAEQTKQIMRNLEVVLRGAGTSIERAVMARIYLINFAVDYPAVNKVYASYFQEGAYPARTTVGVTNLALSA